MTSSACKVFEKLQPQSSLTLRSETPSGTTRGRLSTFPLGHYFGGVAGAGCGVVGAAVGVVATGAVALASGLLVTAVVAAFEAVAKDFNALVLMVAVAVAAAAAGGTASGPLAASF